MIQYRTFRKKDAEAVKNVAMESWKYIYKDIFSLDKIENFVEKNYSIDGLVKLLPRIESGEMFFSVVLDDNQIIGFCNIADGGQGMRILRIYLLPDYFRKGIGKKLLELGEGFIKSKNVRKYFCFVNEKNEIGINFYEKNGFIHMLERDKEGEWYMEKSLE